MIDNFDLIKQLFNFGKGNNMFMHLQILRRGKDHPELPAANKLIQSWLVTSAEHLEHLKDEVIFLCQSYKARAYINVAGKHFDKLNTLILKKLADNVHTGNVVNPWHIYNSACGELTSDNKVWVVDIDSKDPEARFKVLNELDRIWLETHTECQEYCVDGKRHFTYLIAEVPTLNGCHLLTRPFNLQKFKQLCPDVDVHKNNPTVLYVPQSICNNKQEIVIAKISAIGIEMESTYDEAINYVGKQALDEAISQAKAGCARMIDINDDGDIIAIAVWAKKYEQNS